MRNKKPVRKLKKEKPSKKDKSLSPPSSSSSSSPPPRSASPSIYITWAFWYFFINQIGKKSLLVSWLPFQPLSMEFLNWSPSNILVGMWNDFISSLKSFLCALRAAWSGFTGKLSHLYSLFVKLVIIIPKSLLNVCSCLLKAKKFFFPWYFENNGLLSSLITQPKFIPSLYLHNNLKIIDREKFQMECHMDWIADLIPRNLLSSEMEELAKAIIKKLNKWLDEIKDKKVSSGSDINLRLMLASLHALYLSEFKEAVDWVNEAVHNLNTLAEQTEGTIHHVRVYKYLIHANFYKICHRMKIIDGVNSLEVIEDDVIALEFQKIQDLQHYYDDQSFQAVICYAKASLLNGLMIQQGLQVELYRKAIILEPGCAQWHRLLYQVLRKKRREQSGGIPSLEERRAISKAYQLDPGCSQNQCMFANMLDETLRGNKRLVTDDIRENTGNQIVSLMRYMNLLKLERAFFQCNFSIFLCSRSALEQNPDNKTTYVRLGEIYVNGDFPQLDANDGQRIFRELEQRWPHCSMVLHKTGKYFDTSRNKANTALEYFTRSLQCDAGNFPCLMDYLKTFQLLVKDNKHMLDMVEICLGSLHNSAPLGKLLMAKGILLWMLVQEKYENGSEIRGDVEVEEEEACWAWVQAVQTNLACCSSMVVIRMHYYFNRHLSMH